MFDVTIVGCGVIGASLAYKLSRYDLKVLIIEKENDIAMGTTKANSAIVHAGYDPEPGTLMAKLNVRGSEMMEDLCKDLDVKYKRIGSLVLAFSEAEVAHLQKLYDNGVKNGVPNQKILTAEEVKAMEPNLADNVCGALYAPSAAIIDPWGLCIAEAEVAVKNGAVVKLNSGLTGITKTENGLVLHTESGDYETRYAVNCTGACSQDVSAMVGPAEWTAAPARGEYYLLDKSSGSIVNHVIFQCPSAVGKGVLVSPTVHGNLIVGPDSTPVESAYSRETTLSGLDYVNTVSRRSVPGIDFRQSIRNFAGVRAIISEPDFVIRPAAQCDKLLHVAGIKSPGLSAAPAVADYAVEKLVEMGLELKEKAAWDGKRTQIRFKEMSLEEKTELIKKDPRYGRVICRCETITEGEIVAAIHSPIPPCSVDGVKRRAGAGMGRCQGGFCGPRVLDLLSKELGMDPKDVMQDGKGTVILTSETKGGCKA